MERCRWFLCHREREKLLVTVVSSSDDAVCRLQGCPGVETASVNAHNTPESMRPYGLFHGHGFSSDPQGEESKVLNVRKKKRVR